ncbi:MAG: DDE-type integrase/transposase/recombinase, partial [Dehalococcoidia bacterium]|nr:DDE-type integrase/transposase/recombinase [Dehalococcoidia bacterium]
ETKAARKGPGVGSDYMHIAIDDHSRYVYVEALADEKGRPLPTSWCGPRWPSPELAFARAGITVERVLTDNGGCYRSLAFIGAASALGLQLHRTRPFRPQTNGKAEAFNKTLQREWAYRRVYLANAERIAALRTFVQDYNYARPHTAIGNQPPASRLVNNAAGNYT